MLMSHNDENVGYSYEYPRWEGLREFRRKAQVSFSDQNASVVRRRRCRRWRRCCKLFTFSSSSEPLGQFHSNLAQSILG